MAYIIKDNCISCGACAEACPAEAIKEGESIYVIDKELCVSCGACADTCPVDAPEEE
jgi:ferredoxin